MRVYCSYWVVFRKREPQPEPLMVMRHYSYLAEKSPKKRAEIAGFDPHNYVVQRKSKAWLKAHKDLAICEIALKGER